MQNLTIVIPFFNGHKYIHKLLQDLPKDIPVIIVDDHSDERLQLTRENTVVYRPTRKGYFSGAVNEGINLTSNDVLVLNQDIRLQGTQWLELIESNRKQYALIGEAIRGVHPAFPNGYVHGVFQFMRRDAIQSVGGLDAEFYPLWGGSALWQWQICRKGFKSLPVTTIPGLSHHHHNPQPGKRFGDSIEQILNRELDKRNLFIRTPPAISVIVPCYNYGRYLTDCLNSLIGGSTSLGDHPGQTFQSFEVVIVDDGSTDKTRAIAQPYENGWNGIKYLYQNNQGLPAALNYGIRSSIGKYITILSADDMREPWSLEDLYRAAIQNPKHVIYDSPREFGDGKRKGLWELPEYNFDELLYKNHMHSGILFSRTAWEAVGGYSTSMRHGREDWYINVALGQAGYCGKKIERSGYLYRRERQNRSLANTNAEWRQAFLIQMQEHFPHLYRGERPMSCCGDSKKDFGLERARTMADLVIPGSADMVLMEYKGTSSGSITWAGPGTVPSKRYYRFGANDVDRKKYVERLDVPWFLNHREEGAQIFFLVGDAEEKKNSAMEGMISPSGKLEATLVQRPFNPVLTEAPEPNEDGEEEFSNLDEPEEVTDPAELTVAQIKELKLSEDEWEKLLEAEKVGKARLGVIEWAMAKLP